MLLELYPWVKAAHILAIISWMAGLLYLPRLLVYHCRAEPGSAQSETFKVMESRLLKVIMGPAMVAAWIFGVVLLATPGTVDWSEDFWIYGKLLLVVGLTAVHMMMGGYAKAFAEDRNNRSERFFRIINEVPTVIMIGIVVLVTVKPF